MSLQSGNGDSIRRYLLEDLNEQEREQLERGLMSDDDLAELLLLGEDELIDEYISGTLSEQERAKFSQHFLRVPELRDDVRVTAALRKYALKVAPVVAAKEAAENAPEDAARDAPEDTPPVSLLDWLRKFFMRPAVGFAFAAALCAAVALAAWLATQNARLRGQVEQLQARQAPAGGADLAEQLAAERLRNEQLSAELLRERELLAEASRTPQPGQEQPQPTPARAPAPPTSAAAFISLTLTSGAVRDGESGELKKITVTPGTRELRIRLNPAAGDYRGYAAVLQTVEGREVFSRRGLRAGGGGFVALNVPAGVLAPDDYRVVLSGVNSSGDPEEVGSYYFRVLK